MSYVSGTLSRIVSKRIASARAGRTGPSSAAVLRGVSTTEAVAAAAPRPGGGRGIAFSELVLSQRRFLGFLEKSLLLCRAIITSPWYHSRRFRSTCAQ